ncbi:hypothetical protein PPL_10622 [Heterostelium album PN500]|uniref:Ankyrin repeat-containing protein n=1 Tax=Heterostelium pallidum (strain ATCC 26659 / Pp 5 / PN500) TaxID=670386 RepID=D3BRL1_HETP5|nr:hypothetical protein PPL_10622 [Heterostelium album PN500]EFA76043.1 hypothetical protein PPL_10622 [Heterostelium album PN500]|eukprot:XP_020428177.1 hypothetical protein PPL_10622 [Heterostelium album PN500]
MKSPINSVFSNIYLLRHITSFIREQRDNDCPLNDYKYYYLHRYHQFTDSRIINNGWYHLLTDRIKTGRSLRFDTDDALLLCQQVRDIDVFTTVYNHKKIYFTNPECLLSAIGSGNIAATRILLKQRYPVDHSTRYTREFLIDKAVSSYQFDMVTFLINELYTTTTEKQLCPSIEKLFDKKARMSWNSKTTDLSEMERIFRATRNQPLSNLETILQSFKMYYTPKQNLNSAFFNLKNHFSVIINNYHEPIQSYLDQLYCFCKVYGLLKDVEHFKRQADFLLQLSISNCVNTIASFKERVDLTMDKYQPSQHNPNRQQMNYFIQLIKLVQLINGGQFPMLEQENIENIIIRSTGHAYIISFLIHHVFEYVPRQLLIEKLGNVSDSIDSTIVAYNYFTREKSTKTLAEMIDDRWYRSAKCAAWAGDVEKLKNLLAGRTLPKVKAAITDELIKLSIINEKINVLEYLVVQYGANLNKENIESIGLVGSFSSMQLLLGESLRAGDYDQENVVSVHKMAILSGQTKFIESLYNEYPEYDRVYWDESVFSGNVELVRLNLDQCNRHQQPIDQKFLLDLIKMAIELGQIEVYQFFVDRIQDRSILDELPPNHQLLSPYDKLYPMYLYQKQQ